MNSCFVPNKAGLTQSTIVQYSIKLFCNGVPVNIMRRFVRICFSAFAILILAFHKIILDVFEKMLIYFLIFQKNKF